jgi:hypothetical protein
MENYERILKEVLLPRIPVLTEEIKVVHRQAKEQSLEIFKKKSLGGKDGASGEYLKELKNRMRAREVSLIQFNDKESLNVCNNFISREYNSIEKKLKMHEYRSYFEFEKDTKLFYSFL